MRLDTQTLSGMSIEALKAHYEDAKKSYLDTNTRDTRTQSYLMTVDGYIQKLEQEGANN
ncbi:hypothetical protein [Heyndrickxia sporothermodurans]|uniref:hypothetical protein n=1 Tax=Heyndrickxia sporothermodurans TaxID=46224 RepID=UPI0035DFA852